MSLDILIISSAGFLNAILYVISFVIPAALHAVVISLTIFCNDSSNITSGWPSVLAICSSTFVVDSSIGFAFIVNGKDLFNSLLPSITLIITISELAIFEIYDGWEGSV